MPRFTFLLTLALAVIFAGLKLVEMWQDQLWEATLAQQKDLRARLDSAQKQTAFNQSLLKRLALESRHDLAIAELLKRQRVQVSVSGSQMLISGPALPDITGPVAPDNPPEAPAATNPGHP